MKHGFYDPFYAPDSEVVPVPYRTINDIVEATEWLFSLLNEKPLDRITLCEYTSSRDGIERKFNYPEIQSIDLSEQDLDPKCTPTKSAYCAQESGAQYLPKLSIFKQHQVGSSSNASPSNIGNCCLER